MKIKKKQENFRNCQQKPFTEAQIDSQEKEKLRKCIISSRNGENGATSDDVQGKTVIVGIRMDSEGRELLTWALVKVAAPGDTVIALHVLPRDKGSLDIDVKSSSSLLSLVKAFDSVLAVYEGFCNLKQVELKMKICRGHSIRKVLVQEAKSYAAASLIVGVSKNNRAIGYSPISTARYCAKKLPPNCSVTAVNNGKIIFHKEAMPNFDSEDRNSSLSVRTSSTAVIGEQLARKSNAFISSLHFVRTKSRSSSSASISPGVSWNQNFSASCFLGPRGKETPHSEPPKSNSSALVAIKKPEYLPRSFSQLLRDISEARPGWPLLRKAVFAENKNVLPERSKISVVQWAMQLPSRYSVAPGIHPAVKPDKKVPSNVDRNNVAIVSVTTDESCSASSIVVNEMEKIPKELEFLKQKYSSVCRMFSYNELMQITCNFSAENLIGKGGSSRVYKGVLLDGKELAIKILKPSEDTVNEFVSEIEIITSLQHKNIISLLGFCFENDKFVLIYNFLPRGSLEDNLHGENECKTSMSWTERYKVAVGIAEALGYLHGTENAQPVIHRDVKSSNILLSDDFEPQLSDFGLAKWASDSATEIICKDVAGTFGYLAPEYFMYGKVNEKIDVYAFGVVLLELISGRKPVNTVCPKGQESLVVWANQILKGGKDKQLLDPCLGDNYDESELERMALAASLCIKRSPRLRPHIELVLALLQGDDESLKCARALKNDSNDADELEDDEDATATMHSNIQSHINLALFDIDEDSLSVSSTEPSVEFLTANKSMEEYLQGRWSRSSSFD